MLSPSSTVASDLMPRLMLLHAMTERGHLSAAAEAVGVPQPTATRWLSALSRTVGVALTHRVGRRIELTRAGVALAESVGSAHTTLAMGVARAHEAADPGRGQVVFGFLRTMGASRAPELLRDYRATRPRVRLALVQAAHEELIEKLHDGTIDIAMSSVRESDVDIVATELFQEPFVLVVPADHRLARRESVRLYDCRDETFVGLSVGIALRRRVDELFGAARVRPRYGFETDEVETVRGLATAGVGIAVLPARHGGPLAGSAEVPIVPRHYRNIGLLVSTRRPLEPTAEGFRQRASEHSWTRSLRARRTSGRA
ncbi:LysR family transcriptional regulator [Pseudonocardia hierapolitana]|uniref:LysR family transcriptional regulator n=1 Tax=Pseudonocardia hierapolitana TaxID=1128676 RepID=A0A561SZT6_9PSEU|nr:LysR substrate-binding domain-containing protein [Pseudonocardia hierapolitana]TWF80361.1 LysR family transcriptional regulator [Pseudonocardia hierapolitana]